MQGSCGLGYRFACILRKRTPIAFNFPLINFEVDKSELLVPIFERPLNLITWYIGLNTKKSLLRFSVQLGKAMAQSQCLFCFEICSGGGEFFCSSPVVVFLYTSWDNPKVPI